MGIQNINHVAVHAKDVEKSFGFYCDVLGLARGKSVDVGAFVLHYVMLPDESAIELFEVKDRSFYDAIPGGPARVRHFSFMVDDIHAMEKRLKAACVPFEVEKVKMQKLGLWGIIVKGPDGESVELNQVIKEDEKD